MFCLLYAIIIGSHLRPSMPLDELRNAYCKNYEQLIYSLYHNVAIQENENNNTRLNSRLYISYGSYIHTANDYRNDEVRGGQFLSSTTHMKIGLNIQNGKHVLTSYISVNDSTYHVLANEMRLKGLSYLYEIPFYNNTNLNSILTGQPSDTIGSTTHPVRADIHVINGDRIIRLYFRFKENRGSNSPIKTYFGITPAHGYFDIAPQQSWVILNASMIGGRTWTSEFNGNINGVPRLKKVTDRFKSNEDGKADRVITFDFVKYEPTNAIDTSMFEPKYFGINASIGENLALTGPPYVLFGLLAGVVCIAIGALLYRVANKKLS